MTQRLINALRRFWRSTDAAVTTEFVIIFPLIILLIFFIVMISLLIGTTSDVQQIAHELARASFRYLGGATPPADLCAALRTDVLSHLIDASVFITSSNLTLPACPGQPDANGYITITVTYNFAGSFVHELGQNFGLDIGLITRSSTARL
ncbi:TadE/TadG family type IV pilus assembly protein [Cypionkella sp.]|uniref:TadE/TadG family type IV pilus assembly protein n=1 Tax=Cypionkella sp. TaxID=2811411 RepID=UPI002AB8BCC1|nr:TadE/TadG family type IV pilus assembly protein [Cypionkella sp.]MDZ4394368.1 TadE/TadG family type IV pilus assembly protein [Cypionkella sp.]